MSDSSMHLLSFLSRISELLMIRISRLFIKLMKIKEINNIW